ncbi:hypothetical protein ACFPM1_02215 [Halorubrum rubrum]|uniref:Uncharacterized protein n=1 Tax=Halorubrum rubrum TaxID=1126240 RepID=A0ABD5QY15_9EURY|nr:hypothetical protein [Halorubrum rubrum]
MCHHGDEALSLAEIRERHRSLAAEEGADDVSDEPGETDDRAEAEESEPPAEPRAPADD